MTSTGSVEKKIHKKPSIQDSLFLGIDWIGIESYLLLYISSKNFLKSHLQLIKHLECCATRTTAQLHWHCTTVQWTDIKLYNIEVKYISSETWMIMSCYMYFPIFFSFVLSLPRLQYIFFNDSIIYGKVKILSLCWRNIFSIL